MKSQLSQLKELMQQDFHAYMNEYRDGACIVQQDSEGARPQTGNRLGNQARMLVTCLAWNKQQPQGGHASSSHATGNRLPENYSQPFIISTSSRSVQPMNQGSPSLGTNGENRINGGNNDTQDLPHR